MKTQVVVTGDDEAARAFDRFADTLHREVADTDRQVASRTAQDARSAALSIGGVAAHVAPAITSQGDSVGFGGGAWPMAMGAEFGRDDYPQFSAWTGSGETDGYFLVPTIHDSESDRTREYEQALERAMRRA